MAEAEHLEKIYKIICSIWKFYKTNFDKYPAEVERIAVEANDFAETYKDTPEYEFAKGMFLQILSQFERDRKGKTK